MTSTSTKVSGSDVVFVHSSVYGKDTISSKFPSAIDGLKLGHRRIIWTLRKFIEESRSASLINATRDIHFHGDTSIYETVGRLGQEFNYNPPLVTFTSKFGNYTDQKPPAMRYTKVKLAEVTKDLFYNNIDIRSLPKKLTEDYSDLEPIYLVPALPLSLVYYNDTIGFGFNSVSIPMAFSNVCDITCEYIKYKKTGSIEPFNYSGLLDKMLPDVPIKNVLLNESEIKKAYANGQFDVPIKLSGYVELFPGSISIHTLPFGIDVRIAKTNIEERISGKKENKNKKDLFLDKAILKIDDASQDANVSDIRITLKKDSDVFEVWEKIKEYIPFTANLIPSRNYYHNNTIVNMNPINLLESWYRARYDCVVSSKKHRLASLNQELRNLEARILVCDHRDDVINIVKNSTDSEEGSRNLFDKYEITYSQADHIMETRLGVLVKLAKEELLPRYESIKRQFEEIYASLSNIDDEMISYIQVIKKKYSIKRSTKLQNYIGYMRFNKSGIIQLEDFKEIDFYKNLIPKASIEIKKYSEYQRILIDQNNRMIMNGDIDRVCMGTIYDSPTSEPYTVCISPDTAACVVKGFVYKGNEGDILYHVGKKCKVIYRDGTVKTVDVTEEFAVRKTICRGSYSNAIYVFPERSKDCYLAIKNTDTPNSVTIQKLSPESNKVVLNPAGDIEIQHFYYKEDLFINMDSKFLNRNNINGFRIRDITDLIGDKQQLYIDINSTKWKTNRQIDIY